mmetsp:Transcript_7074/g.17061  ORF Transcript_7074/g.17061 Transcript_7074/m.17061 type:complete len:100 (+) Transcript_7074:296-595(+)
MRILTTLVDVDAVGVLSAAIELLDGKANGEKAITIHGPNLVRVSVSALVFADCPPVSQNEGGATNRAREISDNFMLTVTTITAYSTSVFQISFLLFCCL